MLGGEGTRSDEVAVENTVVISANYEAGTSLNVFVSARGKVHAPTTSMKQNSQGGQKRGGRRPPAVQTILAGRGARADDSGAVKA